MNVLRSLAVVYGPAMALGLQSATQVNSHSATTLWLSNQSLMFTWVTVAVMGAQLIAVVIMLIRGIWLRKKEGPKRKRARSNRQN